MVLYVADPLYTFRTDIGEGRRFPFPVVGIIIRICILRAVYKAVQAAGGSADALSHPE